MSTMSLSMSATSIHLYQCYPTLIFNANTTTFAHLWNDTLVLFSQNPYRTHVWHRHFCREIIKKIWKINCSISFMYQPKPTRRICAIPICHMRNILLLLLLSTSTLRLRRRMGFRRNAWTMNRTRFEYWLEWTDVLRNRKEANGHEKNETAKAEFYIFIWNAFSRSWIKSHKWCTTFTSPTHTQWTEHSGRDELEHSLQLAHFWFYLVSTNADDDHTHSHSHEQNKRKSN